ncbi:MAG TPA: hypothetical protein VMP67_05620 [Candidatus Limnocylindria bacterium]|nr:hypothetical protein [Candidatus Limnocylindria bacterium]
MNSRRAQPASPDHARHDELLVVRYAASDSLQGEEEAVRALLRDCPACASLAADIRLLSSATSLLPSARRRRDFRLSPEQAQELRGSWFERLLRRLAGPGLAPLRPVAGVALSLGIVLAGAGVALPQAASPALPAGGLQSGEHDAAAPEFLASPMVAAPGAPPGNGITSVDGEEAPAERGPTVDSEAPGDRTFAEEPQDGREVLPATVQPADPLRSLLTYGGLAFALLSLGVLLLTGYARHRTRDPLLL